MSLSALLLLVAAAQSEPAEPVAPCRATENARALDFWLGDWRVVDAEGREVGRNRIEAGLDGCAVFENWTGTGGGEGHSLFYFDATADRWEQVWVTGDTSRPFGLKRKRMTGGCAPAVCFVSELRLADGRPILDRTILTPLADGRVRQVIAVSADGGQNWRTAFEGIYEPAGEADS
jgi:hypothetical protein